MKPSAVWALAFLVTLSPALLAAPDDAGAQQSRPRLFSSMMQGIEARVNEVERTTSQLGAALGDLNDTVSRQAQEAAAQITALSSDLNTLGAQIAAERDSARDAASVERLDALARRVETLRVDIAAFSDALAAAQTQATQSEARLNALNALVSEQAATLQSTALTAARLSGLEQALTALDNQVAALATRPDPAAQALERRLEALDAVAAEQAAKLRTTAQALDEVAALGETVASLEGRLTALAAQPDPTLGAWLAGVDQTLSDHTERLERASQSVARITSLVTHDAELEARIGVLDAALTAQTAALRADAAALERRIADLAQPNAALEARLAALDAALSDQQSAIEAIAVVQTEVFSEASETQDAAAAQTAELGESVAALEGRMADLARPDAALEARLAALDAALADQAADVAEALEAAARAEPLSQSVTAAQERLDRLKAALEEQAVKVQISTATQTAALGEAVASLRSQVADAAQTDPAVLARLDDLEATAAQRAEALASKAAAQDARLDDLRAQTTDLAARVNALAQPDAALADRLRSLDAALTAQAQSVRAASMTHTAALSKVVAVMARPDESLARRIDDLEAALAAQADALDADAAADAPENAPQAVGGLDEDAQARITTLETRLTTLQTTLDALSSQPEQHWATSESVDLVAAQVEALAQAASALQETVRTNDSAAETQSGLLTQQIDALVLRADSLNERVKAQNDLLENHEGRIEDNALKLYEVVIDMERVTENLQAFFERASQMRRTFSSSAAAPGGENGGAPVNPHAGPPQIAGAATAALAFGLSLFAPLGVFLMGARFNGAPEADASLAAGVALTWSIAMLSFALAGAGIALGPTLGGWIGDPSTHFSELIKSRLQDVDPAYLSALAGHSVLAGLAALVACSAAPRLDPGPRALIGALIGLIAYPLAAHWTREAMAGDAGWIAAAGYVSPGGAAEIAVIGGFSALFLRKSSPQPPDGDPAAAPPPAAALGALALWAAWLGASLAVIETHASPLHVALTSVLGAAAACLTIAAFGLLASTDPKWMTRLGVAALAGAIAGPAASVSAPLAHAALVGAIAAAFFIALTQARSDTDGLSALACAVAAGGAASVLAPAVFGSVGLLARGTFEAFFSQASGAAALGGIAVALGFGGARAIKALAAAPKRRKRAAS